MSKSKVRLNPSYGFFFAPNPTGWVQNLGPTQPNGHSTRNQTQENLQTRPESNCIITMINQVILQGTIRNPRRIGSSQRTKGQTTKGKVMIRAKEATKVENKAAEIGNHNKSQRREARLGKPAMI